MMISPYNVNTHNFSLSLVGTQSSTGKSVVLITSESATGAIEDALDLNELMSATDGSAMAVEITDCVFKVRSIVIGLYDFSLLFLSPLILVHGYVGDLERKTLLTLESLAISVER